MGTVGTVFAESLSMFVRLEMITVENCLSPELGDFMLDIRNISQL